MFEYNISNEVYMSSRNSSKLTIIIIIRNDIVLYSAGSVNIMMISILYEEACPMQNELSLWPN